MLVSRRQALAGAFSAAAATPWFAHAQGVYPSKPITWIVMWRPGGGADTFTRVIAKHIEPELGQKIVVQNIDGGAGTIGYIAARSARPDGYTVVTILGDMLRYQAFGLADIGPGQFDVFAGIAGSAPIFAVRNDSRFKTVKDFIEGAKQKPDAISVAVSDLGGYHHIPLLLLEEKLKFKTRAVAHPGTPQINAALVGGHVDAAITTLRPTLPYIKDGQMRVLATFDRQRTAGLPEVPTMKELGFDVEWVSANGVGAPKGTPAEVRQRWAAAVAKVLKKPEIAQDIERLGYVLDPSDGPAFTQQLLRAQDDLRSIAKLLKR